MNPKRAKLTVTESKFQFTIEDVSKLRDTVTSPPCFIQHLPWNIIVKPEYESKTERRPLGLSIICEGNNAKKWSCLADVEFSLYSSKKNRKPFSRQLQQVFTRDNCSAGFTNFITWHDLVDSRKNYVTNNSIIFEVCVTPNVVENVTDELNNSLTEVRFRHTYKNILNMQEPLLLGPFTACDLSWKILVKPPSVILPVEPQAIGLFLQCNSEVYSDKWACLAKAELGICSTKQKGKCAISRLIEHEFSGFYNTSGWKNLILWKDLLDENKDYVKNDTITVQAHVSPSEFDLHAFLSIREGTFWYTVENISKVTVPQSSPAYIIGNLPWRIRITPIKNNDGKLSLGYFLNCNETNNSSNWSCNADAELRIRSCEDDKKPFVRKLYSRLYVAGRDSWGTKYFIAWEDLLNPSKGFVKNDSVTFEAYIRILE
ncbi:uncharacterized protein LOC130666431 [Microplitis mediator]|uniref:uncharacterized protein LOC130666431 n=1 Tax=Microplitis mediator TaxID=375433 RepID=UPI002556DCC7|nr:uncharacterized protein LOC130666431 [Microplitis mediator]